MSDQDKGLVEKGAVKKVVTACRKDGRWDLFEERIDALGPIPAEGPSVSRKTVWDWLKENLEDHFCTSITGEIDIDFNSIEEEIKDLPSACTERSERVLPGRSEEEIREAIETLRSGSQGLWTNADLANFVALCFGLPQTEAGEIWPDLDFAAPDPADKEGGTSKIVIDEEHIKKAGVEFQRWPRHNVSKELVHVILSPVGQDKPDYEAILKAIRLEIQGYIEAGISSPTWEEVLVKIKRIEEAFKHKPTKPEAVYVGATCPECGCDIEDFYRHTPQAKPRTEKPEGK